MGFMDKAKKLAEQAQEKLDEVHSEFSAGQRSSGSASSAPPPPAPATEPPAPPAAPEDVDRSHEKPPTLSSGDPLAG